jgi:hypothetical protein
MTARHPLFSAVVEFSIAADGALLRRRARPLERLTRWALPSHDGSIDALSALDRKRVENIWTGRCFSEVRSVSAFEHVAASLEILDGPKAAIALARRAVDDERRHIEICRRVASAYAPAELPVPVPMAIDAPSYGGADRVLEALLRVVGQCSLNETTACAFARHCLSIASAPLVRAALRDLFAAEIDHARIGWLALASAPAELRKAAAEWMPRILDAHLAAWSDAAVDSSPALLAHGVPAKETAQQIVRDTLDGLILPGLALLGIQDGRFL